MALRSMPGSIRLAAAMAVPIGTAAVMATAAMLAAGVDPAQAAGGPAAQASAGLAWRLSKTIAVKDTFLTDVVAFRGGTAWAGGQTPAQKPVLYHLTGGRWHAVPVPGSWPGGSFISNVNASSATNVWATIANGTAVAHLTSHGWVAKSFAEPGDDILMDGVATTGPKNTWVFTYNFTTKLPHAKHYNGSKWTSMPLPALVDANSNTGLVSASSADNIWTLASASTGGFETMRYNGSKWQTFKLPANSVPAGQSANTRQILAESATNVWVTVNTNKGTAAGPVVLLHWRGHGWSKVTGKVPAGVLTGAIAADGHGGLWLGASTSGGTPFFLHYAKGVWTRAASPADAGQAITLSALALIPGTRALLGVGVFGQTFVAENGAVIVRYGR